MLRASIFAAKVKTFGFCGRYDRNYLATDRHPPVAVGNYSIGVDAAFTATHSTSASRSPGRNAATVRAGIKSGKW